MSEVPDILIAGIGNIFFGDDAFGCQVVGRCAARPWPKGVRAVDFGIRGLDLAYALLDGTGLTILVDAVDRRQPAGTLFLIRPEVSGQERPANFDDHSLQPEAMLRYAQSLGADVSGVLLVGCQPGPFSEEGMQGGSSAQVEAAVGRALTVLEHLVDYLHGGGWQDRDLESFRLPAGLLEPAAAAQPEELAT